MSPKARAKLSSLKAMRAELPAALGSGSSSPAASTGARVEEQERPRSRGFEGLKALRAELPAARGDLPSESGPVASPTDTTSDSQNGSSLFPPIGNKNRADGGTSGGSSAVGSESFNLMKRKIRKAKLQVASKKLAAAGSFQLPAVNGASPRDGDDDGAGTQSMLASASGTTAASSLAGESFVIPRSKSGSDHAEGGGSSTKSLAGLAGESFKVK